MWLQETSHDIVFEDLDFVGTPGDTGASMLIIDGDRITFRNDDIRYVNGICVDVGAMEGQGGNVGDPADDFVLDRNRIHDCGTSRPMNDLGASGLHGVYIQNTNDAVVTNNVIYDNMNRGLQLYPLSQGTLVEFNVLDGNSSNLNMGGYQPDDRFSDDNVARNNIITNALLKTYFVPGWPVGGDISSVVGNFPENRPVTNQVTANCLWYDDPSLRQSTYYFEGYGIDFSGNTFADPRFTNRAAKDFTLQPGSPCAGKGPQPLDATTCAGLAVTVVGTAGGDVLTGTAGVDVIAGLGGNDTISALAGNDVICAGDGDDVVSPGSGNETSVDGGAGSDTISYSDTGSAANINLTNGDMFHPGGDPEYDTFTGFENAVGGSFADTLIGAAGANWLQGGAGIDTYSGEAGSDTILARDGVGSESINCGADTDTVVKDASDAAAGCETVLLGSASADFDGDGDSDVSVFHPGSQFGEWNILGQPPFPRLWGAATDVAVPASYDGDPVVELAVFRRGVSSGEWYVEGQAAVGWGAPSDTPVAGDYDGDGDSEPAVFRQGATYGEWYVQGRPLKLWGLPGDVAVPGDYDGDGDVEVAVFRRGPQFGEWYIEGQPLILWGSPSDMPVPADYDGDGDTDVAVFRSGSTFGEWYVRGGAPFVLWGPPSDLPMPGDYDGDGDTDIAVFRRGATFGEWYVQGKPLQLWGGRCDTPLPLPYHLLRLLPTGGC
jgi:hypothetical protein